jgi:hypothetical protein
MGRKKRVFMRKLITRQWSAAVIACLFLLSSRMLCHADEVTATQPAVQVKTGTFDLTFKNRSPLSTPKELARRLSLKPADVATDYDLSQKPYKAYVPTNYDPAQPVGVLVYLGYKDSVSTPPLWQPMLEESHLIFITPVCHSGDQFPPSVPIWQTTGLAMDAVYNLKRQYAIDPKRVYLMSWTQGSIQRSLATSDVFTGFIVTYDQSWFKSIRIADRIYPAKFSAPPGELLRDAESLQFFLIDDKSVELAKEIKITADAMREFGFEHVMQTGLSSNDDLHFPNLKAEWFSHQALQFLDEFSTAEHKAPSESQTATTNPEAEATATAPSASPGPSEAQALLAKAQLLMSNGRTDLARTKLQDIIQTFPNDPVAAKAKQLLDQINNE